MDSQYVKELLASKPGHFFSRDSSKRLRQFSNLNRNKRPLIRPRTTGLVGPEIDWSVRESDLLQDYIYLVNPGDGQGNLSGGHQGRMKIPPLIPNNIRLENGRTVYESEIRHPKFASTFMMTDEQVIAWTKLAHFHGVEYRGPREYTRPKAKNMNALEYSTLANYVQMRLSKQKRKSRSSGMSKLRKKLREFSSFEEDQPGIVVTPFSKSAKILRSLWKSEGRGIRFSVFRERFRKPTLCLLFKGGRITRINEDVKSILYKIYSKTVWSPSRRSNMDWSNQPKRRKPSPPPTLDRVGNLTLLEDNVVVRPLDDYLSTLRHGYAHRIVKLPDLYSYVKVIGGLNVTIKEV